MLTTAADNRRKRKSTGLFINMLHYRYKMKWHEDVILATRMQRCWLLMPSRDGLLIICARPYRKCDERQGIISNVGGIVSIARESNIVSREPAFISLFHGADTHYVRRAG